VRAKVCAINFSFLVGVTPNIQDVVDGALYGHSYFVASVLASFNVD